MIADMTLCREPPMRYKGGMDIKKWEYLRDEVNGLNELDSKLAHWGGLGWELASVIQTTETGNAENENILTPERWMILLKRPSAL
jgi:hypothetical protein